MTTKNHYVAQEYVASSPKAEVIGGLMLALVQNLKAEELRPLLRNYGLEEIDPSKWYPQQIVLDFYKSMAENSVNSTENLVAIGMKAIDTASLDPQIKTFEEAVTSFDSNNLQIIRNVPDEERYFIAESDASHVMIVDNTPYPSDMTYGYLWALARRFKPANGSFSVHRIANPYPDQYPGRAFNVIWG